YIIDERQKVILKLRSQGLLEPDPHVVEEGVYTISSLYFDSLEDSCFYENENGEDPREKYRIRIYDCDSSRISLECKAKERMMTKKTSCLISRGQCERFMQGEIPEPEETDEGQAQAAMFHQMRIRNLRPVVIVQYMRTPFISQAGNVRVTYDEAVASSDDIDGFFEPDIPFRSILPVGCSILEVKWDELLAAYIKEQLELGSLQWSSFSKYYLCRKYNSHGGVRL
ncbi:MAG: polyphosphate polymerase domain-containing protein, partial [Lachnospiraceae bacterium]|nr:polyphosphate polymerase domain-containing protein [Lachnospiraceae bacterium]